MESKNQKIYIDRNKVKSNYFTPELVAEIKKGIYDRNLYYPTYYVYNTESDKKITLKSVDKAFKKLNTLKRGYLEGTNAKVTEMIAVKKSFLETYVATDNINSVEEREIEKSFSKLRYCTGKLVSSMSFAVGIKEKSIDEIIVDTFSEAVKKYNENENSQYIDIIASYEDNKPSLTERLIVKENEVPLQLIYDVMPFGMVSNNDLKKIKNSINALEGREKYAVVLKYYNQKEETEYSSKLNVSFQTSKKLLGNALLLVKAVVAA